MNEFIVWILFVQNFGKIFGELCYYFPKNAAEIVALTTEYAS